MAQKPTPSDAPAGGSSTTSALWGIVLAWVLVRLVAGGRGAPEPAAAGARAVGGGSVGSERGFAEKRHAAPGAAREPGRGREAASPTEIPSRGWKDVLWRVYEEFGKDRVTSVAAGVTYFALLAIFPAIAALVSIYGLFADPATIEGHLNALGGILPSGALDILREQVTRIASQGGGTLGTSFAIGLALSLWSANAGMKAIFDALNIVYDEEEKRGFFALNLQSLAFTLGALVFILLALAGIVVLPVLLDLVGLGATLEWALTLGRWPILLLLIMAGLAVLYRYGPSRDRAGWKWVTPGGLAAAVLWVVGSMLFSWYVANFGSYNETYGSLGAVIGFMTWIWISSIIVLMGAEINAEVEHQTAHDTTGGPRQPMGRRGASMADTVGAAKA
jgi:membrane protein